MRADLVVGNLPLLQERHEMRPRHVEQVGRLLGCQLGVDRHQRHRVAARHLLQDIKQQAHGHGRQGEGFGFAPVLKEPNRDIFIGADMDRQLAACLLRQQRLVLRGQEWSGIAFPCSRQRVILPALYNAVEINATIEINKNAQEEE